MLKLRFLGKHRKEVKAEYLKHPLKTGYISFRTDSHSRAAGKTILIEIIFDEGQFVSIHEQEARGEHTAADEGKRDMICIEIQTKHLTI